MMEPYEHQLQGVNFYTHIRQVKRKKVAYSDDILTFDIEVTSAWINEHGNIIRYHTGRSSEYWQSLQPLALCYIWQFSFNDHVYYGRELTDFLDVLRDLPKNINFIIWVHNLSYEFHFLQNILTCDTVFARSAHKPIKCIWKKFPHIEFRCSYMLTRLSLADWGQQIGLPKMVGDLNYERIRTPKTVLSEKELHYCERDCEVVYAGIMDYLKRYRHLEDIPLTQTGTVRRVVKERLIISDNFYRRFIKKLCPKNAHEYKILQRIFAGGYTHANRMYAGDVIREHIEHYDFASSYPTVMICEKYPMSPWVYTAKHEIPDENTFEDTAYIMHVKITGLLCQTFNTYLQASKCDAKKAQYDNGRVISADEVETWITEQDYMTLKESYTWDSFEVLHLYKSRKQYLPRDFILYILELYENKTKLKGLPDYEDLYLQSKQYINALFGMMVTAICQADIILDGDEWKTAQLTEDVVTEKLQKLISQQWSDQYFLSYSWGCWVTAYARRNLWKCLLYCDMDALYCDTDSIFVKGTYDFSWYNDEVTEKIRKMCDLYGIDFERTRPKKKNGKPAPLGIFEKEDDCTEFITLGAKRYVERRATDGRLHLTVAGINKESVELLHNDISNFKDGFNFDKDKKPVHKQLITYVTDMPSVIYPDGYRSTYTHGINMRRTGYLLSMTDGYKSLIKYFDKIPAELPEQVKITFRGKFHVS